MVELFVEGMKVDISQDLSSMLSFSIDDIKDFAAKNSPVSKTIVLPGTKNNNKIFGNAFDIAAANSYDPTQPNKGINFNAAITARAVLFNGNIQCMKGVLQILQITVDNDYIEYEVGIWGELTGFVAMMAAKLLTGNTNDDGTPNTDADLDFSAYDHAYTLANIVASWSNAGGSGYYYPLIDYGNYSVDKHSWKVGTFRPALYVKEYIDKIFAKAGYTYDCDLFNTTRFKKLVVPHNQKQLQRYSTALLNVSGDYSNDNTPEYLSFPINTVLGNFTNDSNRKFTYNIPQPATGTLTFNIVANISPRTDDDMGGVLISPAATQANIEVFISGTSYTASNDFNPLPSSGDISFSGTIPNTTINEGNYIQVAITTDGSFDIRHTSILKFDSTIPQVSPVTIGENLGINGAIPRNITQVEFFSSIIKLFQLYVYEDPNKDRHLLITPFVDMFNNSVTQDWSRKLAALIVTLSCRPKIRKSLKI